MPFSPQPVPRFVPDFAGDPQWARFTAGPNAAYFHIVAEERFIKLHPDLPASSIWGYRDVNVPNWPFVLGPTFVARFRGTVGDGVVVRMDNQLPAVDALGIGHSTLTMHLHGGHHPAIFDGFPANIDGFPRFTSAPGQHFDHLFTLTDHNFDTPTPNKEERPALLWYHDHILDFTGPNVYRGLSGATFTYDDLDTGDEATGLRLPANVENGQPTDEPHDLGLVLQDKRIDRDGRLVFDTLDQRGFLGDKFLVNGAIQPRLRVKGRKYRFRFLNGSNARLYQIVISDKNGKTYPFTRIASEGGLFSAPIRGVSTFLVAMAERVEIVFDFSGFAEGTELFLENRLQQTDGRKPDGVVSRGTPLMKFIVEERANDVPEVPNVLRPFRAVTQAEINAARVRTFEFDRRHGMWAINGNLVDLDVVTANPRDNVGEIWHFINKSGGWVHPIHTHSEFGRVLKRNGKTPPLYERDGIAKKDTVLLGENQDVHIFFKFLDFRGPFVFHCHNLEHEDMAMMGRFDVVP